MPGRKSKTSLADNGNPHHGVFPDGSADSLSFGDFLYGLFRRVGSRIAFQHSA